MLGPLLFLLCTAEIFSVVAVHGASAHFYADDGQLYVDCPVHSTENAISQLADCIRDVATWNGANRLPESAEDATDMARFTTTAGEDNNR